MNNDLNDTQLENMLRGISPAAASPALVQRVDEELKLDMSWLSTTRRKPRRTTHWLMSAGWAAMGAAAAIAVMSHLPQEQSSAQMVATAPAQAPVVLSPSTIREWDDVKSNSGIHQYASSRKAEKHAIVISRELQTWVDPRYGAQTTVEIPSQHNLLMPVSYIK